MDDRLDMTILEIELEAYRMTKEQLRDSIVLDAMYLTFLADEGYTDLSRAAFILLNTDCNIYKMRLSDEEREEMGNAIFGPREDSDNVDDSEGLDDDCCV